MTEERLKEIKDSIDKNLLPTTDIDWYTEEVVNEELELYNEVIRLREIIDELEKTILFNLVEYKRNKEYFIDEKNMQDLYDELIKLKENNNDNS